MGAALRKKSTSVNIMGWRCFGSLVSGIWQLVEQELRKERTHEQFGGGRKIDFSQHYGMGPFWVFWMNDLMEQESIWDRQHGQSGSGTWAKTTFAATT